MAVKQNLKEEDYDSEKINMYDVGYQNQEWILNNLVDI